MKLPDSITIVWEAYAPLRPWRPMETGGDYIRRPNHRGDLYPIGFRTVEEAWRWLARYGYETPRAEPEHHATFIALDDDEQQTAAWQRANPQPPLDPDNVPF